MSDIYVDCPDCRKTNNGRCSQHNSYTIMAGVSIPAAPAPERPGLEALDAICRELEKATAKFPTWPARGIDAAAIVAEESGELQQAALQATYEGGSVEAVRKEAIQTAAMAIQFLLNLPVTQFDRCKQVPKIALAAAPPAREEPK